jgi:hypothetical protein
VRCGGRRSSSSSSTRRSARQRLTWWLAGWLAGSRTFKRTKTTTIETLCHASIVVREHGSFLRNPRRSKRGFHSESRAVTKLLLGRLLSSSRSSCKRHGTTTTTKKKKQMRTRQDFWNCTLLCNLFLVPSLVSSPSRRWNSSCLPSATVAPSCSRMQCFFFFFFFFLDLSASGTATCIC